MSLVNRGALTEGSVLHSSWIPVRLAGRLLVMPR